jgi:hypothetical protein
MNFYLCVLYAPPMRGKFDFLYIYDLAINNQSVSCVFRKVSPFLSLFDMHTVCIMPIS